MDYQTPQQETNFLRNSSEIVAGSDRQMQVASMDVKQTIKEMEVTTNYS